MWITLIGQIKLNDKTYNEIFQQALNTIPILSNEWTDYNYSDPGITTLQTLSVIKLFQQAYVDKIRDNIKYKLIKLLGYNVNGIIPSVTNLAFCSSYDCTVPTNTKMLAGSITFETMECENVFNGKLEKIVLYNNLTKVYFDMTTVITGQSETITYIFGEQPTDGSVLYFVFNNAFEKNINYRMFIDIDQPPNKKRNFIPLDVDFKLSDIEWEYITEDGWKKLSVIDETKGFLQSGNITFNFESAIIKKVVENIGEGYIIKATLKSNEYDLPPRVKNVAINVCKVRQADTQAKSFVFNSNGEDEQVIMVNNFISIYNNIIVLVKDEKGIYHRFTHLDEKKNGMFCNISNDFKGNLKINFSKNKYGTIPLKGKNAIKVICYSDYLSNAKIECKVYGFDDQIINLKNMKGIIDSEFSLMLKVVDDNGVESFYDVDEEENTMPLMKYELNSLKNEIKILEVNLDGDINIVITNCVLSKGRDGNVRKGEVNKFLSLKSNDVNNNQFEAQIKIENLCNSTGGRNIETIDDVVLKIIEDISSTHSLVTKKDYETKIFEVPGINIHKVKAICDGGKNSVSIIVKPNSNNPFPVLTDEYKKIISRYIDKYRLVTTQINIMSPVYVPINVTGSIYIKPNYKKAAQIIKNLISQELDGINTDKDFGYEIVYGDLYSKIENLSCVDVIDYFLLEPVSSHAVKQLNSNILLDKNALGYMGEYDIAINNNILTVV